MPHLTKCNFSTTDRLFNETFRICSGMSFQQSLKISRQYIHIASRITALTTLYSAFQNYTDEMDSHLLC